MLAGSGWYYSIERDAKTNYSLPVQIVKLATYFLVDHNSGSNLYNLLSVQINIVSNTPQKKKEKVCPTNLILLSV